MGYVKQANRIQIWGKATRDAQLRTTKNGKHVVGFGVKYDRHSNEDGQTVNEYMEVSAWGDLAVWCGDEQIGIAKGDTVIVCGELIKDDFYRDGEDKSKPKYKVNADVVLDATSIFQLMKIVMSGEGFPDKSEKKPKRMSESGGITPSGFDDITGEEDEDDPFSEMPY